MSEVAPGSAVSTARDVRQWISRNALPNSHWVGTAKMGLKNDSAAVVDAGLRVRGVKNLRVAGEITERERKKERKKAVCVYHWLVVYTFILLFC